MGRWAQTKEVEEDAKGTWRGRGRQKATPGCPGTSLEAGDHRWPQWPEQDWSLL